LAAVCHDALAAYALAHAAASGYFPRRSCLTSQSEPRPRAAVAVDMVNPTCHPLTLAVAAQWRRLAASSTGCTLECSVQPALPHRSNKHPRRRPRPPLSPAQITAAADDKGSDKAAVPASNKAMLASQRKMSV